MNICVLGRQPAIGLAELEVLYGAHNVTPFGENCALVDASVDFARLGGTVKMGSVSTAFESNNLPRAFAWAAKNMPLRLQNTTGKLQIGVSLYGFNLPVSKLNAHALSLKKALKNAGHSVRATPNTESALSSAQSYHNKLAGKQGYELIVATDGRRTVIARLTDVQDIDSYTLRDRGRPKRDAFVGMLPPKLAQTIINLANPAKNDVVLDPFCGTGVVLMEAGIMGFQPYGTDIQEKMVRYSRDNVNWLREKNRMHFQARYEVADATEHIWLKPINTVACEGYLGQPLGGQSPSAEKLSEIMHECDSIMRAFLENINPQLLAGTRLCIAMPCWFVSDCVYHLSVLNELAALGFSRPELKHASYDELIYRREDQAVGRELVILTKS
jgi:tRNA G10  N-methylase Trm11